MSHNPDLEVINHNVIYTLVYLLRTTQSAIGNIIVI